ALQMNKWESVSFLDDNENIKTSMGLEVIGTSKNPHDYIDEYEIFVGIGNNDVREKIHKRLSKMGARIPILIHPSTTISQHVNIGEGTAIMAGAIINCGTIIGKGCIINTGSTVDHDNTIKDFVHLSPGVHLAGTVEIG